ncbi:Protein of unknown function [Tangfeifania diversioriginum]|uniref:DUF2281 domain-containing protein n=1 Tax=Tangfeifania diversioriginum TaxID=1168035 RepID=A0A1M6KUJ2_9BACT|nr:DUF2281 domain-containing protein [Tangfeifania diversioriginum]SHJ62530.1 Protein of unknown function [Tangfeifania diversioriginum]
MEADILIHKFQDLPKSAKKELLDFLDFLSSKYEMKKKEGNECFSFDWSGGLKDLDDTSVGLQHKANQWR